MAAYCTNTEVKTYLGISGTADDALITALIARAQAAIDRHTHRTFSSTADSTRSFTVEEDTDGRTLWFDEDIVSITTVTTNADASTGTTVSSTEYTTLPRNRTPYYGIKIKSSVSKDWTYENDPETGVTVAGKWAYSTTPPDDVKHACVRLSSFYYQQKDAQVYDVTTIPDAGIITLPQGIPADVQLVLEPYVKRL